MRRKLPKLSGREVIELLVRKFGFTVRRQRGSHVVLVKYAGDRKIVTIVPLHPELKPGTLLGVLELAEIDREEFLKAYEEDC
ncbi:MAG: type II toxin-antitoxin system HicA family toxin [Desulfurococcales archaeon]|nr:type II toxin-antitoxin system HicA family toxin [Desulfurococcales archaeon]